MNPHGSRREWPYWGLLGVLILFHVVVSVKYLRWEDLPAEHDPAGHLLRSLDYTEQIRGKQATSLLRFFRTSDYYPPLYYWTSIPFEIAFGPSKDAGTYSILPYFALALVVTYWVGRRLFSPSVGLLAAAFLSLYPIVFGMTRIFYPDLPLLSLTILGFYFLLGTEHFTDRRHSVLLGVVSGLAFLVKWTYPIFLAAPFCYSLWIALGRIRLVDGFKQFRKGQKFRPFVFWYLLALIFAGAFVTLFLRIAQVGGRPLRSMPLIGAALFHLALFCSLCAFQALRILSRHFPRIPKEPLPYNRVARNLVIIALIAVIIAGPWYMANWKRVLYRLTFAATQDAETRGMPGIFLPESFALYLFYLEGHQVHLLFFTLAGLAVIYHLRKRTPAGNLVLSSFGVSYLLLCGIRLKDPRFSMPYLPYLALLTASFVARAPKKAVLRYVVTATVLVFGFYQMAVITFGDAWLPPRFRIPEKVSRGWKNDAEIAWFKKYGYGTQYKATENWEHDKVFDLLENRWSEDNKRKALVRVIGNHHHFHHGSLEFLARCEGRRLRFVPGLTGDLVSGSSLAPLLDADFILMKVGKDPGPDFSIPNYEKVRRSLEEDNGILHLNQQEIFRVYTPDGDYVVGYRKKETSGTQIAWKIDWGIGWVPGYQLSSRELRPGEPLKLTVDWRLTPNLVRSYVFFVHLIDDRGADIGDFLHPEQRPFSRFQPDVDMSNGLQGPVPCEYVVLMEREGKPLPPGDYLLKIGIWEPSKGKHLSGKTPEGRFEDFLVLRDTPIHVLPPEDDAATGSGY